MDFPRLQVRPCIADFLRTGCRPPELLLRVERVIEAPVFRPLHTHDKDNNGDKDGGLDVGHSSLSRPSNLYRAYRLLLSDGEHTIQALLKSQLHPFISHTNGISPGAVLDIEDYELRTANRTVFRGARQTPGKVVFLAVGRYKKAATGISIKRMIPFEVEKEIEERVVFKRAGEDRSNKDDDLERPEKRQRPASIVIPQREIFSTCTEVKDESSQPCHSEEKTGGAMETPISHDTPATPQNTFRGDVPLKKDVKDTSQYCPSGTTPLPTQAVAEPSLPILTLSDLLFPQNPFPKRNHACNVVAVISWISPEIIKRAYMPLKRDLRLIDPTIIDTIDDRRSSTSPSLLPSSLPSSPTANGTMGVSMSVFVDAAKFYPPVGTVVLFRGLKTHEWDGISLNAYEKDCRNKEWFITDPGRLAILGVDASALKEWWLETQSRWEDARKTYL